MKYSSVYLILALGAILSGNARSQAAYDQYCNQVKKEGAACVDRSHLGMCMLIADNWHGFEIAECDSRLCCDVLAMGCVVKGDCADDLVSTTTACVIGELKKHPTDCTRYYYCLRSTWVETQCPSPSVYDDYRKSCVFGTCQ